MRRSALALVAFLAAAVAGAQDVERDVASLRTDFEYGKYEEVLRRGQARLDQGVPDSKLLVEIHKLTGVSAFNLGKLQDAQRHLSAMLRVDPDETLDPFVYPPPVIEFHDKIRKELAPELERIRQTRELETARKRAIDAEAEKLRIEEERRRLLTEPRRTVVETVEHRSYFVNFVPFGAGQFQQGRTQLGLWLASLQGATAAASIIAYWAHEALIKEKTYTFPGTVGEEPYQITVRGIRPEDVDQAANWRLLKYISGAAFYGIYAFGVIDALLQHEDTITSTRTVDDARPPSTVTAPTVRPLSTLQRIAGPQATAKTFLFPTPGGVGAGLELRF